MASGLVRGTDRFFIIFSCLPLFISPSASSLFFLFGGQIKIDVSRFQHISSLVFLFVFVTFQVRAVRVVVVVVVETTVQQSPAAEPFSLQNIPCFFFLLLVFFLNVKTQKTKEPRNTERTALVVVRLNEHEHTCKNEKEKKSPNNSSNSNNNNNIMKKEKREEKL